MLLEDFSICKVICRLKHDSGTKRSRRRKLQLATIPAGRYDWNDGSGATE